MNIKIRAELLSSQYIYYLYTTQDGRREYGIQTLIENTLKKSKIWTENVD